MIASGKSRFIMDESTINGLIIAQIPTIKIRLKMLDPITLLNASSLLPERPAVILTAASGALVPIATIVRPMITEGTFNKRAMAELPITK